jgi:ribonuclease G
MNETDEPSTQRNEAGPPAADDARPAVAGQPPAGGEQPARSVEPGSGGAASASESEPASEGDQPAAAADDRARTTEPGAWAAQHARRTRAQRPGRRSRRPAATDVAAQPPADVAAQPAADVAAQPAADDERDVIVASAAPEDALLERSPAPVSDEAMAAAAADEEVTPARRRRRGRRGRGGGAATAAAPDVRAAGEAPTDEVSPGSGDKESAGSSFDAVASAEGEGRIAPAEEGLERGEPRPEPDYLRSYSVTVEPEGVTIAADTVTVEPESVMVEPDRVADLPGRRDDDLALAVGAEPAGAVFEVEGGDTSGETPGETPDETPADDGSEEQPRRRHRGHRGGRRHKRKNGESTSDEAAAGDAPADGEAAPVDSRPAAAAADSGASEAAASADLTLGSRAAGVVAEAPASPGTDSAAVAGVEDADQKAPARRSRRRGRGRGKGVAAGTPEAGQPTGADPGAGTLAATTGQGDENGQAQAIAEPETTAEAATATPAERPGRGGKSGRARAGRAKKDKVDATGGEETTVRADGAEGEPVGRRRGGRLRRPKETGVTADLPGYKEILVSEDAGEMRVALVEDGRLAEIYIERPGKRSYAGNIYRGKVDNVLPGMDAAFVDIGLERNGFLYVDDIADPDDGEKRPHKITQMLKPGQEVLVQVNKDPMGSKGARLTGQLSLAGRYLVYVPGGSGVGVSRRLPSDERDRLRELCKSLKAKNAGLIVRTVAEGKSVEEMKNDLRFLSRLWTRLKAKAEKVKAPGLIYAEADVSLQVARDLYNESFAAVLADDPKRHHELVAYLEKVAPELATRVKVYEGDEPLFRAHGIEEQIAKALERKVLLPSGGNLVIDHTEALTVIDVNTGRFTGGKGLEDTITRNNLEAAREVVRQLRLRDIGGIIIIDFIDMEYARNREAVLAKLQAELETDRTKTYVVEISPLGLVEMTRQNITDGARGILTQTCPFCEGKARILSPETMAITIERRLGEHAAVTSAKALLVEVNTAVAERLVAGGRIKRLEKGTGKQFFLEGSKLLPVETFRIVAEGSLEAVESHRIPVREDQEVTVELEYALTYSPGDAIAHVDGFQLVVLNGRKALGETRKVRITSLTRAGAMGVLVS